MDEIKKTHQLSVPILAEYSSAVFALQEAHKNGAQVSVHFGAWLFLQTPQPVWMEDQHRFYEHREIYDPASFSLDETKVVSFIPDRGSNDYKFFYLANFGGGKYSDERKGISQVIAP